MASQTTEAIASKTFCVTGGCGFIGSHLVEALVAANAKKVFVVDSLRYGRADNLIDDARIEVIQHTLGEDPVARLEAALTASDYLVHLAAEKHNQSKDTPQRVYQANIAGTHDLLQAAADAGVKRAVFSSSLYAYGRMAGEPMVETDIPEPHTVYGITKLAGEHIARFIGNNSPMECSVLRYFFVYGPKQFAGLGYKSVIVKNFERMLAGQDPTVFGDGEQSLDYTYVDDLVEATLRALFFAPANSVLNVGSGVATSVNTLLRAMKEIAKHEGPLISEAPDWTAGTRRVANVDAIAKTLDWKATTPLQDGLEKTFTWLAAQKTDGKGEKA